MKVIPDGNNQVSFRLIAQTVTVDWGDGNVESPTPIDMNVTIPWHQYANQNMQTVTVKTSGLRYLGVDHAPYDDNLGIIHELTLGKCPQLTQLYCSDNQLTNLDVSKSTALAHLNCSSNQITSLDVSKNTALTVLYCSVNQITSLDVSKNTALTELYCVYNQLTNLDVSKNTALTGLYCYYNQLTNLDVSNNTALTWLLCSTNQLTNLDVSQNTALTGLNCSYNQLTADALNALFNSLPIRTPANNAEVIISGNPGADACDKSIAENKGWNVF
jgi:Leucine-rich repeat (LRR) protein